MKLQQGVGSCSLIAGRPVVETKPPSVVVTWRPLIRRMHQPFQEVRQEGTMFISLYRPSVLSWIKLLGIPSTAQAVSLLPSMRIRYVNANISHSIKLLALSYSRSWCHWVGLRETRRRHVCFFSMNYWIILRFHPDIDSRWMAFFDVSMFWFGLIYGKGNMLSVFPFFWSRPQQYSPRIGKPSIQGLLRGRDTYLWSKQLSFRLRRAESWGHQSKTSGGCSPKPSRSESTSHFLGAQMGLWALVG